MNQTTIDFYNSTATDPEERLRESVRAGSQTAQVWQLMKDGQKRTSVRVASLLGMNLNSARRALTDLSKKFGLITKLNEVKLEEFGANNHYYQKS